MACPCDMPKKPMSPHRHQPAIKSSPGATFKLVQFAASGREAGICGLVWLDRGRIRLASPTLRWDLGRPDAQVFLRLFPGSMEHFGAFGSSMTWLGLVAPAAADLDSLQRTCAQHPEQRLRCVDCDDADERLLDLFESFVSCGLAAVMPGFLIRIGLTMTLESIVRGQLPASAARLRPTPHEDEDVALLELGADRQAVVTLNPQDVDALAIGLAAHDRMHLRNDSWSRCLLVMPRLELREPLVITSRVTAADLSREVLAAAITNLAQP